MSRKKRRKRAITTVTVVEEPPPVQESFCLSDWEKENRTMAGTGGPISLDIKYAVDKGRVEHSASYEHIIKDSTSVFVAPRRSGKTVGIAEFIMNNPAERVCVVSRDRRMARDFSRTIVDYVRSRGYRSCYYDYIELTQDEMNDSWLYGLRGRREKDLPTCVIFDEGSPMDIDPWLMVDMYSVITYRNGTGTLPFVYLRTPSPAAPMMRF